MEHNSESYIVVKEFTDKGKTTREVIAKGVTKQGFVDAYIEKGCVMRGGENPHFEDIYSGVVYKLENHFEQGGQVDRERDIQIAKTILMQLGGSNRLQMFTGAYNFVAVPYGVSFRIKNRSVNYVKIVLNAMDTYDIEFGRISGVNYKIVKELSGIYNDQLVEIFTRYTGMVLRLRKGGAIQGEENAEMVMNQNLQIRHHTEELEEILKSGKEVPAWVVSKISRAADSMSDATHYLEGTPDKMARGGNPRMVDISKLKTYVLTYIPVFDIKRAMQIKQKAVYAESEEDAIAQLPRTAKVISIKVASGGNRGIPQQQNRRKPSLSQQIRNEIKALKEMLPLLEGKDKKQVQDVIENLEDTLDEMRAEGQYAKGGGVGEIRGGIRYVKGKELEWHSIMSFDIADYGEEEAERKAYNYIQESIKYWNGELNENDFIVRKSRDGKDYKGSYVVYRQFPKYAKGGGVGEFPTKGELTNKDNFLLKYEKKGGDYEFYIYKPETKKVSAYNQVEHICINSDFPYKMSYEQFINYLYAELYLDGGKYANGGGVGELEKEIDAIYFKSGFINYDFNWRLKLLEMLQDQSIEAYNIYQKLTDKQKDDVLQEQFEMDNDMGSDGDGEMETSFENLNILLQDASNGEIYAKGGEVFVCPVGTQIQSLIFDKSMFNLRQAKAWAKKNNFENDFVDGKLNTLRIRQKDPAMFTEDGFRTIQLRQGVQAVIGCPKKRTIRRKK